MKLRNKIIIGLGLIFLLSFCLSPPPFIQAEDNVDELQGKIKDLENKLSQTRAQKATLASQINYMNQRIQLATLRISQTNTEVSQLKEDIEALSVTIAKLDISLDKISRLLLNRIVAVYKQGYQASSTLHLLMGDKANQLFKNKKYLEQAQKHDKLLIVAVEQAKQNFDKQKELKEVKREKLESLKTQLETQNIALANEKKDKEYLLIATQNDEKKYQQLLAQAEAEYQAIQGILAGGGDETEVGKVNKGEVIATVISGTSCNSSGTHLHFTITENGNVANPFSFLKSGVNYENCSGYSCGSGDGDSFNPSGSWEWPLSEKITLTQGYGHTWAVDHTWVGRIYSSHNGIDIKGGSSDVRAVQTGNLYRGSYTGYRSCRLRYVKLDHEDSNINTYYLHVNYTQI